jgi:hypothetical protein
MSVKHSHVEPDRLSLIARADEFRDSREPLFHIGTRVQLNSGSPPGLVVNKEDNLITVAWVTGEADLPAACIHRVR